MVQFLCKRMKLDSWLECFKKLRLLKLPNTSVAERRAILYSWCKISITVNYKEVRFCYSKRVDIYSPKIRKCKETSDGLFDIFRGRILLKKALKKFNCNNALWILSFQKPARTKPYGNMNFSLISSIKFSSSRGSHN